MKLDRGGRYLKEREKREGNGTHVHENVKGSEGRGGASQKWAGDGGTEKETNQNQVIMACINMCATMKPITL